MLRKEKLQSIILLSVVILSLSGCAKSTSQDTGDSIHFGNHVKNASLSTEASDTSSETGNQRVQFSSDEDAYLERPTYTASDYIILSDYSDYDASSVEVQAVTEDDVAIEILRIMVDQKIVDASIGLSEAPALTNELAATLSGQAFQTAKEYREHIKSELENLNRWNAISQIYDELCELAVGELSEFSYPEDVYAYDLQSDDSYIYLANMYSKSLEDFYAYLNLEENASVKESIEEIILYKLMDEMITVAFMEQENISLSDSDYEEMYKIMQDYYDERTTEQLFEKYGEETVKKEAAKLKTAEILAINAGFSY